MHCTEKEPRQRRWPRAIRAKQAQLRGIFCCSGVIVISSPLLPWCYLPVVLVRARSERNAEKIIEDRAVIEIKKKVATQKNLIYRCY